MAKPNTIHKTKLTEVERRRVLMALLLRSTNGDLKRGDLSAVAAAEGIHPSTISRLWARAKVEAARSGHFASPSRRSRSGSTASDPTPTLERLRGVDVAHNTRLSDRPRLHVAWLRLRSFGSSARAAYGRTQASSSPP
ncbi:hypothetical protein PI124_g3239 [Phytophthora idaei]|nr:hypothetical protein PI125_g2927 [Phytophthora idaei]KAG3164417.1 hypothetical protein PI126_g5114 [Phytophthora idaei]KAG3252119.1 hypothetical protein PI124_g3239 [Phytophthora idaei]